MILGYEANIGLIYYGPKWSWAEMVMGRNGHGPKWLWAEMTRNPAKANIRAFNRVPTVPGKREKAGILKVPAPGRESTRK